MLDYFPLTYDNTIKNCLLANCCLRGNMRYPGTVEVPKTVIITHDCNPFVESCATYRRYEIGHRRYPGTVESPTIVIITHDCNPSLSLVPGLHDNTQNYIHHTKVSLERDRCCV